MRRLVKNQFKGGHSLVSRIGGGNLDVRRINRCVSVPRGRGIGNHIDTNRPIRPDRPIRLRDARGDFGAMSIETRLQIRDEPAIRGVMGGPPISPINGRRAFQYLTRLDRNVDLLQGGNRIGVCEPAGQDDERNVRQKRVRAVTFAVGRDGVAPLLRVSGSRVVGQRLYDRRIRAAERMKKKMLVNPERTMEVKECRCLRMR